MCSTTGNDCRCKHCYSVHSLSKTSCLSSIASAAVVIGRSDSRTCSVGYCAECRYTLFLLAGELSCLLGFVCTEYLFSISFWNVVILNVAWKETSIVLYFGIMLLGVGTFLRF